MDKQYNGTKKKDKRTNHGTPAFSTTKTGHHNIAEILLKVALNTISQIK
jgi:hypothetical protein